MEHLSIQYMDGLVMQQVAIWAFSLDFTKVWYFCTHLLFSYNHQNVSNE